jgi:hypothetical protein
MDVFLEWFLNAVKLLNRITVTGILVTAFSLVIYIGLYNRRSDIARNFAFVLACVIGTFLSDLLTQVSSSETDIWLRLQWVGIAMIPAASLHLSDALLRATGNNEPVRRFAVKALYGLGTVFVALALFTDLIARSGITTENLPHLFPGPLFILFTLYYFPTLVWATYNVIVARRRALTATSKRRLTRFAWAFAAPAVGMFPYFLPTGWPTFFPQLIAWLGILFVNAGVGTAITFMTYTVSYFGASAPDRVIKRRWVKWVLRGPALTAFVITAFVLGTRIDRWLGLPGTFVGLIAGATIILLHQLFIITLQPTLDRIIAGDDSSEVRRLQQFGERLMTTSDRVQYLEGILAALCDLLRARNGFITMQPISPTPPLTVIIGSTTQDTAQVAPTPVAEGEDVAEAEVVTRLVELPVPPAAVQSAMALRRNGKATNNTHDTDEVTTDAKPSFELEHDFITWQGYWLIPLHTKDTDEVLGVMGLEARAPDGAELNDEEREGIAQLVSQAALLLEDAIKQQRAFEALERLMPDADNMQRRMAEIQQPAAPKLSDFSGMPTDNYDDFTHLVRDALSQYWGGPKLVDSPLMSLQVVGEAMTHENGNATKALRRVLSEAIERVKPDGNRSMTATEWMLYNILELKIIQGQKVRDVARKLVMSESDLYRKQRAAFEEVARQIVEMEREARNGRDGDGAVGEPQMPPS